MPVKGELPRPSRDEVTAAEIATLDPRRQIVLNRRRDGLTLREIGQEIGFTQEWVRQLERSALLKIKRLRERQRDLR